MERTRSSCWPALSLVCMVTEGYFETPTTQGSALDPAPLGRAGHSPAAHLWLSGSVPGASVVRPVGRSTDAPDPAPDRALPAPRGRASSAHGHEELVVVTSAR